MPDGPLTGVGYGADARVSPARRWSSGGEVSVHTGEEHVEVAGSHWDEAPDGTVLDIGGCGVVDGDGQGCARALFHPLLSHQHTGLRRWLEATQDEAVIRIYDGSRGDELEEMESPVFEALGFSALARRDVAHTTYGAIAGLIPRAMSVVRLRVVCYARR